MIILKWPIVLKGGHSHYPLLPYNLSLFFLINNLTKFKHIKPRNILLTINNFNISKNSIILHSSKINSCNLPLNAQYKIILKVFNLKFRNFSNSEIICLKLSRSVTEFQNLIIRFHKIKSKNILIFRDDLKFSKNLSEFKKVSDWISEFNYKFS